MHVVRRRPGLVVVAIDVDGCSQAWGSRRDLVGAFGKYVYILAERLVLGVGVGLGVCALRTRAPDVVGGRCWCRLRIRENAGWDYADVHSFAISSQCGSRPSASSSSRSLCASSEALYSLRCIVQPWSGSQGGQAASRESAPSSTLCSLRVGRSVRPSVLCDVWRGRRASRCRDRMGRGRREGRDDRGCGQESVGIDVHNTRQQRPEPPPNAQSRG
ncbi:hypothetical protein DFP72DRAFT_905616 [Ephemerocybe angulata]|uniref:Uncharacterized protein n=1 Tax=Ephemerocybe angulata TaxID=980116 RepID=A0A8H6M4W6_9AGAR|nr:hypothetical protein DFP72DRAFT_905608 [Tulosesus angulatus]KAF6752286.1 hypothetical protein DFP72DRAFT_905616 [Tulosesus angulatus]